jgi:predicted phosphodiesterase
MVVAALYDVHGNVHALEAVLADVGDVDVVLFGGDIASGPFPRETLDLVRSLPDAVFVRGNADEVLALDGLPESSVGARRWVAAQVGDEGLAWLAGLPFSWSADDTLYVHANPVDVLQFVAPRTPDARVAELLAGVTERRVVTGHVHLQFEREVGGVRWIGAGSVGFPYVVEDPCAEWVLVDGGEVSFRRTRYDVAGADAAILASEYPRAGDIVDFRVAGARWIATAE